MRNTLQEQYNLIKEGKGNKQQFFKSARHLFPDLITPVNTYEDTVRILKNKSIIAEGIGGVVTKGKTPDWHAIFKENITEAAKETKAKEKETTKEVADMATRGYDYKDYKNIDNVFGETFLKGFYTEMGDPKNEGKTVEELRQIVAKNLAKDCLHYTKEGQFGLKGVGYTMDVPGLGEPKPAKGKHKSSGYGDLQESVLRSQIYLLAKEILTENIETILNCSNRNAQFQKRFIERVDTIISDVLKDDDTTRRFTKKMIKDKLIIQNNICPSCKKIIKDNDDYEGDHIIPWTAGGNTTMDNLQVLHKRCHQLKSS